MDSNRDIKLIKSADGGFSQFFKIVTAGGVPITVGQFRGNFREQDSNLPVGVKVFENTTGSKAEHKKEIGIYERLYPGGAPPKSYSHIVKYVGNSYSALENRALEAGVDKAEVEEAKQAENSEDAFLRLILEREDRADQSEESLRMELASLAPYILQQHCEAMELFDVVQDSFFSKPLNLVINIFKQMCEAVQELHLQNIAHMDIKFENFMYDKGNKTIYVIDFNFSIPTNEEGLYTYRDGLRGTAMYMAPEIYACLLDETCNSFNGKYADIWSLGVCLHLLFHKRIPVNGMGMDGVNGIQRINKSRLVKRLQNIKETTVTFSHGIKPELMRSKPEFLEKIGEVFDMLYVLDPESRAKSLGDIISIVETEETSSKPLDVLENAPAAPAPARPPKGYELRCDRHMLTPGPGKICSACDLYECVGHSTTWKFYPADNGSTPPIANIESPHPIVE